MSMSNGNSVSYALVENFLKILQGPIFFSFNLLYFPLGNLSFLRCASTRYPTSNCTSFFFKSTSYLYLTLLSYNSLLTYSSNDCIATTKSSSSLLLIYMFPKFLSSQIPVGCMPYIILNGLNRVLLLGESLNASSTCGSAWSHCFGWSLTKLLKIFPKLLLLTSVYPPICGWYAKIKPKSVPIFFHKVLQMSPTNIVSLSETILLGNPCNLTIYLKNKLATWVASLVLNQGIQWPILENMSTMTKIESWPIWVLGSPITKSILTTTHGWLGIANGWYNPTF